MNVVLVTVSFYAIQADTHSWILADIQAGFFNWIHSILLPLGDSAVIRIDNQYSIDNNDIIDVDTNITNTDDNTIKWNDAINFFGTL